MIDIAELTKKDIGRWVVYNPGYGVPEKGRIKDWNPCLIFVVYKCDNQWDKFQGYTAAGTYPKDLEFAQKEAKC